MGREVLDIIHDEYLLCVVEVLSEKRPRKPIRVYVFKVVAREQGTGRLWIEKQFNNKVTWEPIIGHHFGNIRITTRGEIDKELNHPRFTREGVDGTGYSESYTDYAAIYADMENN